MAYEHPLADLLGLEGIAEIRTLPNDEAPLAAGVAVERAETFAGYADWVLTYDDPVTP